MESCGFFIFCSLATAEQVNTPVKYHEYGGDKYLLLGTWASTTSGNYKCVDATDGSLKWTFTPSTAAGFYWAGAACFEGAAIFGDDQGNVHVVELDQSGTAAEVDQDSGTAGTQPYDLTNVYIRTSVCYYDDPNSTTDYLYLADYSGYLYQLTYDSTNNVITGYDRIRAAGVGYSTSTPVRIDDYVFYGTEDGLSVATIEDYEFLSCSTIGTIGGKVQSSPVVYKSGSDYYIYVTKNTSTGTAYCIRYNSGGTTTMWSFDTNYYTLQGFAAANGRLYFGNDGGYLYVVY